MNPKAGGAEAHLHEVFGRLANSHQIDLLVSGSPGAPAREMLDGMDVHRVGSRYTFSLAAPRYYARHLRGNAYDLVIEDLNKVPLFATRWARRPLVLIVHHLFGRTAFEEASLPLALATWLLEKPLAREYRNVPVETVSDSSAADLIQRGFSRDRITVIPNGVDLDFFTPDAGVARAAQPTLLYLGRLKRYKRVDLIIRALHRLRANGVDARLVIAGRGDAEASLRQLVQQLGLGGHVQFAGYVSEAEKLRLFRTVWVHVLTSPKEGWGISNLEAAACGTPTVASDSPGLRDSVRHGETGFLVPHGDIDGVARRLQELIENQALRARLGAQARRFAERFTWDGAAARTEQHLLACLANASR